MKRRKFIKIGLAASAIPVLFNGIPVSVFSSPFNETMALLSEENDKIIVLINLNGGNDGLNTVIPLNRYSELSKARENILIAEDKVLKLNNFTGLHPSMSGMAGLFDQEKLCIVQSVGYPNPNFSHFRSTDIWHSASDSDKVVISGWLGRYLNEFHPDYPTDYPSVENPDPLSITVGNVVSETCQGSVMSMGMAVAASGEFYNLNDLGGGVTGNENRVAIELDYLRQVISQTNIYTKTISAARDKGNNMSSLYPAETVNKLADQLKLVAKFISGGLKTKIYVVSLGGFDTHSAQVESEDSTEDGTHSTLLKLVSEAVSAFQDDLRLQNLENKVIGMTYSEFGRRIMSNSSLGSDHGTAAPLFIFGSNANPVIHGENPIIPEKATAQDNLDMQYDFRQIYYSLLLDWFNVPNDTLKNIMLKNFDYVKVIKGSANSVNSDYSINTKVYPNPAYDKTFISHSFGTVSNIEYTIYDLSGRSLVQRNINNPSETIELNVHHLQTGAYMIKLTTGTKTAAVKLMKM